MYFDLHRHDECSFFDGFGKPKELVKIAKELGYPALGISNHGNITGLIRHWQACKAEGIKPILGVEAYFQPKYESENPSRTSFHLCLFVKNFEGYKNLCHMLTEANKDCFYYKAIIDFKMLEKYHKGLICTSACVGGAISQALLHGKIETAEKLVKKYKKIFKDDFFIELQPYKVDEEGTQEIINRGLIALGKKHDIKCILTSDSHYGKRDDFDTYEIMHKIGNTNLDVRKTYRERYMPSEKEIVNRFFKMHKNDYLCAREMAEEYVNNLYYIFKNVDNDILEKCAESFPRLSENLFDSQKELKRLVANGLKKRGKWNDEYKKRCAFELSVIHGHKFDDYFLMVRDYVDYAKSKGIEVGYGRGSACNCLVAYALGITEVDSIKYALDFSRFMRADKRKMPDIDVDFETDRRQEVINYVINRHSGKAVQICSYSEYTVDALVNDLSRVCGFSESGHEISEEEKEQNKEIKSNIKKHINVFMIDSVLNVGHLAKDKESAELNRKYNNVIKHFCKMYGKIRHLGKHAAGVAVVGSDISDYTAIVRRGDMYVSSYDLNDLEIIKCLKFDMLGLRTLSEIKELRELTGYKVTDSDRSGSRIYEFFRNGETDGIFQMERSTPKKILNMIHCDNINDVIAVNALNRPSALQLKMHETYAHNKLSGSVDTSTLFYECTKETYGTMLYQEQTIEVAQRLGHLSAQQGFDLLKIMKKPENLISDKYTATIEQMKGDFLKGCKSEGLNKGQAEEIWKSMLIYGFNKGHSTGYSLISIDQMFYKINYPAIFYYVKMKYAPTDSDLHKFSHIAIKQGVVVFLPHVNYTAKVSYRNVEGESIIQLGTLIVKGVGEKAAKFIEEERNKNGAFKTKEEFIERCQGRAINKRVIEALEECGALEFNSKKYMRRIVKYNSAWLAR